MTNRPKTHPVKAALIKKYGSEAKYREHMRLIRTKVKAHPGGAFRDPEFARQAGLRSQELRRGKKEAKHG